MEFNKSKIMTQRNIYFLWNIIIIFVLFLQMQNCHWGGAGASPYHNPAMMSASMLHHTTGSSAHHNSCMAPQMNMPNFMGVSGQSSGVPSLQSAAQATHHLPSSSPHHPPTHPLNQQPSQQAAAHLTPPPPISPLHDGGSASNGAHHPAAAATAALSAAVAAAGVMDYASLPAERRSSSIACLRLKAREHSVAAMGLGIFNSYGK